jgi:hypothetical protein
MAAKKTAEFLAAHGPWLVPTATGVVLGAGVIYLIVTRLWR